jgi:hypothetical protein
MPSASQAKKHQKKPFIHPNPVSLMGSKIKAKGTEKEYCGFIKH